MKLLKFFFLFALIYSATAQNRLPNLIQRIRAVIESSRNAINQQFIDFFERERPNFSTGWPQLGIPPIDPLYIREFEANIDELGTLSGINFRLSEGYFTGLQDFEIENVDVRIIGLTVRFEFLFKQLVLDGQHSTQGRLGTLSISGNGPITIAFNDFRVIGEVQINTISGGYLNLETLAIKTTVESVSATLRGFGTFIDPAINLLLSTTLPTLINDGGDFTNELIEGYLIPVANEFLNQYRIIDVILAVIPGIINPSVTDQEFEALIK